MKKFIVSLIVLVLCSSFAFAEDSLPEPGQDEASVDVYLCLDGGSITFSDGSVARDGFYHLGAVPEGSTIGDWLTSEGRQQDIARICNPTPATNSFFSSWSTSDGEIWSITDSEVRADALNYDEDDSRIMTLYANWKSAFTRISGNTRYETSRQIADQLLRESGKDRFDAVIVASGENYPDALSGSSLAAATGAPVILTNRANDNTVASYILQRLRPDGKVYILGGEAAIPQSFESSLSDRFFVERLAGSTRIETNMKIIDKVHEISGYQDIIFCTAYGYADSLSASATGRTIMLVGKTLTKEQKDFIIQSFQEAEADDTAEPGIRPGEAEQEGYDSKIRMYAIGGPKVVSKTIVSQARECTGFSIKRLYGDTRYETSALVAKEFFKTSDNMLVAYGNNFPDGLSGSSLALLRECPLVLAKKATTKAARGYARNAMVTSLTVLGGKALIPDASALDIINGYVPESHSTITSELLDNLDLQDTNKLMIVAHPDDETLWGGCHLAEDDYLVVCLTNGDNVERNEEFTKALSISGDKSLILRYPDAISGQKDNWKASREDIAKDINVLLSYKDWDAIVCHNPDGEYGHLHHINTSEIVADACNKLGCYSRLYYFEIYFAKDEMPQSYKPNMSAESQAVQKKMLENYVKRNIHIHTQMNGYEAFIKASQWGIRNQLTAKAYQQ